MRPYQTALGQEVTEVIATALRRSLEAFSLFPSPAQEVCSYGH